MINYHYSPSPFIIGILVGVCSILCLTNITAAQWPNDDPNRWGPGKDHIVVVKIKNVKQTLNKSGVPEQITYKAKAIYDMMDNLTDHEVTIIAPLNYLNDTFSGPRLSVGDTTILHIRPEKTADSFICEGYMPLPIGLDTSLVIQPSDFKDVLEAIKLVNTYLPIKDAKKGHADALMLMKSKNYYIWALGAWMLAKEGTKENVRLLEALYSDDADLTMTQFIWINILFDGLFPEKNAPDCDQREHDYVFYLKKHSKPLFH